MIVLDTNVVSELMRPRPNARVLAWVDAQPPREVAITSITAAELRSGVERLPFGRRRTKIAAEVEAVITEDFASRVLPFSVDATPDFARLVSGRESAGHPMSTADGQIAAICRTLDAVLATRNANAFDGTGVEVVNPWET